MLISITHRLSQTTLVHLHFLFLLSNWGGLDAVLVALNVPSQVRKGSEVELSCLYDLGNASLYSLKWFYRANDSDPEEVEFFRFTPNIQPVKQYFPIDDINVNVNRSEGGRLILTETNGKASGNYKCEISVEGTFQTVSAEKLMTVLGNAKNKSLSMISILISCLVVWLTIGGSIKTSSDCCDTITETNHVFQTGIDVRIKEV